MPTPVAPTVPTAAVRPRVAFIPTRLVIATIGVSALVGAKPTQMQWDPFLQKQVPSFGIPSDLSSVVWWSSGAKPGQDGLAVIVGHTNHRGWAVFNALATVRPGAIVVVAGHAAKIRYRVIDVVRAIPKADGSALARTLSHAPAGARLALITCTGTFNGETTVENTVVFAEQI